MPLVFETHETAVIGTRLVRREKPFPGHLMRLIQGAYEEMPALVQTCITKTTAGTVDWKPYREYFDPSGPDAQANARFVRSVFATLLEWRLSKTIRIFHAQDNKIARFSPTMGAYVHTQTGEDHESAHVGSGIRVGITNFLGIFRVRQTAAMLCHELVHKLGRQLGRDIVDHRLPPLPPPLGPQAQAPGNALAEGSEGYGRIACLELARRSALLAITNADNYRCYMKQVNRMDFIGPYEI